MNILNNPIIREALVKRWNELELRNIEIIKDAAERGIKITEPRLSKYRKSSPDALSSNAILFMLIRWGIYFNWNLGRPSVVEGKVRYYVPSWNEADALKALKVVFPDLHESKFIFGIKTKKPIPLKKAKKKDVKEK